MIRIVKVNKLRTPEQRATVCYVGRYHPSGWPNSGFGNILRLPCPGDYRTWLLSLPETTLTAMLVKLWAACDGGAKPLGCWCFDWTVGDGPTPPCHAAVLAELLHERFTPAEGGAA